MSIKLELMREHIDPKKSASVGLLGDVVDKLVEELRLLADRIKALEAEAAKPRHTMTFAGDWIEGSGYDAGELVQHGADLWLAIQPREPRQAPSRATGWTLLVQGAQP